MPEQIHDAAYYGLSQESFDLVQNMRIIDDIFMNKCLEDIPCVETILQVILDKPDLKVISSKTQEKLTFWGRSVCFDVYAVDDAGKQYDIEIQRSNDGANIKRARYHSAMIDVNSLQANENFKELHDNYVIFITEHDVFKKNLPLYTIHRHIDETNEPVNDGTHIIYVNGALRNDKTPIGKLMSDFFARSASKMFYNALRERAGFLKSDKWEVKELASLSEQLVQKGRAEGVTQGITQGIAQGALNIATKLIKSGKMTLSEIAEATGLTIVKLQELAQSLNLNKA